MPDDASTTRAAVIIVSATRLMGDNARRVETVPVQACKSRDVQGLNLQVLRACAMMHNVHARLSARRVVRCSSKGWHLTGGCTQ